MIDLHMHSLFSDGALLPAEVARRAEVIGCRYIAITDHVDMSNVEFVSESIAKFCEADVGRKVKVIPGVEVTHVTPGEIAKVIKLARKGGVKIALVHGETIAEPVEAGTNEAAIDAGANILAHPGLITPELAKKAAKANVTLELSGRGGHGLTNGHVARIGLEAGANLVFNTDSHAPKDIMGRPMALKVLQGAGLTAEQADLVLKNSAKIVEEILGTL